MKKTYFLLLLAFVGFAGKSVAQISPCGTDEMRRKMVAAHPEILQAEAQMEKEIQERLKHIDYKSAKRTTFVDQSGNESFWYDIPIVLHIIHNYGVEDVLDDSIFSYLVDWNKVYAKQNWDTSLVIPVFQPYVGNPHIRLHLATIDPQGRPTKGITRHYSYLTYIGGEQSKLDDWPPSNYVNIWSINMMSAKNFEAAAYAYFPSQVAANPQGDGIISLYNYLGNDYSGGNAVSKTINHEMGHVFNLEHPWGLTNSPGIACGDDGVDDTPPTKGHLYGGCTSGPLYDTVCSRNYFKIYSNINGGDSLVNYPDTTNAQNIMDYTYCARMFTKGQVTRMHAALNSDVAARNNLWDSTNLANTGALEPRPDLKPNPEFAVLPSGNSTPNVGNYFTMFGNFVFPGNNVRFVNKSWNDTVTSIVWSFSNSAAITTQTVTSSVYNSTLTNSFQQSGWVDIKLTATGNHTGDTTADFPNKVYVADATATPGNVIEEFNGGDIDHWPIFNYYNNEFKWQVNSSVGLYDNSSIEYVGFDSRVNTDATTFALPYTGTPMGDVDDFFSVPFDLSTFTDAQLYLNFFYSAASRSSLSDNINDMLEIDYSANKGVWTPLDTLRKGDLANKGAVYTAYTPSSQYDWSPKSILLPPAARTAYTTFRFRYFPYTGSDSTYSSGNNFFMDRLNFQAWPASVADVHMGSIDMAVEPNPTHGDAWVVVKDAAYTTVKIVVTDLTGKQVYTTIGQVGATAAHIQIPHSAIATPGMYMVEAVTGNQATTKKLVVY